MSGHPHAAAARPLTVADLPGVGPWPRLLAALRRPGCRVLPGANVMEDSGLLVTPDVVVISEGRFRQGGSTLRPSELSLVVEVESHTTRRRDRTLERSLYEEWGVPYLLIDPDTRTISYYGQPPWPLDLEDIFD